MNNILDFESLKEARFAKNNPFLGDVFRYIRELRTEAKENGEAFSDLSVQRVNTFITRIDYFATAPMVGLELDGSLMLDWYRKTDKFEAHLGIIFAEDCTVYAFHLNNIPFDNGCKNYEIGMVESYNYYFEKYFSDNEKPNELYA